MQALLSQCMQAFIGGHTKVLRYYHYHNTRPQHPVHAADNPLYTSLLTALKQ